MRESLLNLTKEKDKLLSLSMERGQAIQVIKYLAQNKINPSLQVLNKKISYMQEKQEEILQLETKLKEEKHARAKAEDRYKHLKCFQCFGVYDK